MHITLDEFNEGHGHRVERGILGAEEYGNALMESLGTVKAAKSDPGFIKIIKAEMNTTSKRILWRLTIRVPRASST